MSIEIPSSESPEKHQKQIFGYLVTFICAYRGISVKSLERLLQSPGYISNMREGSGIVDQTIYGDFSRALGVDIVFLKRETPCSYQEIELACAGKTPTLQKTPSGKLRVRQNLLEKMNELGFTGFDKAFLLQAGDYGTGT